MRVIRPQDLHIVPAPPPALERRLIRACNLVITVAGIVMKMRFGDAAVRERFAYRYRHHVGSDRTPDIVYSCGRHDDGSYFFWSPTTTWSWPAEPLPMEAIVLLVDATAMSSLVRSDSGLVSFHAAAIRCGGAAAAIVGDSTAGKTTTTVACARRGMQVYSDERLLLDADAFVLPFLRAFNIRRHGASLLHEDAIADELGAQLAARAGEFDWIDLSPLESMPHLRVPDPKPLRAIFLLDGKADRVAIRQVDSARSCPRLLESIDCAARARIDRAARVMSLLRRVAVFSLTLGRPNESAQAIEATVQGLSQDAA